MRTLTSQEEDYLRYVASYPGWTCDGSCIYNEDSPEELENSLESRGLIVISPCRNSEYEHATITGTGLYVLSLIQALRDGP